jgi:hypothetical protein
MTVPETRSNAVPIIQKVREVKKREERGRLIT